VDAGSAGARPAPGGAVRAAQAVSITVGVPPPRSRR
jgi:hypothetical protein